MINDGPIQIRSKSRTHSQINTSKQVQGFLAINFIKSDTPINLKALSEKEYSTLIYSLKDKAKCEGYLDKSSMYDYIITKVYSKYVLDNFTV